MVTELEEQNLSIALSIFSSDRDKVIQNGDYNNPKLLFEWIKSETTKLLEISQMCDGTVVAMKMGDELDHLNNSNVFKCIIDHGNELGIAPDIQATDPKYKAIIVMSIYLGSNGLGNRLHKKD